MHLAKQQPAAPPHLERIVGLVSAQLQDARLVDGIPDEAVQDGSAVKEESRSEVRQTLSKSPFCKDLEPVVFVRLIEGQAKNTTPDMRQHSEAEASLRFPIKGPKLPILFSVFLIIIIASWAPKHCSNY